ncbi:LysR family transcriptional regulator [Amycolatopsis thermophila]|uniref:DNA-binding transcriptional LysR family regulator n=1 Tax=Amycolatopsis thermophila TaxID=206084 RepID=A0ABU0F650_9PSEU|nr:LysR family transcriptional regulator [Amycolatopsis thermophila]MDQ0382868.1 DNA-binding transcriptional LysR family regulator [Amycolatopsis thermophila]
MSLATIDLNLLRSLDALLDQRSVTLAAQRMGLSQPSMSAALAKLRRHFDDELLIRVGREYRLTPLAVQLRYRVRVAVAAADRVFDAQPEVDLATSTREFRVMLSDYALRLFGADLAALLGREAPRSRLRFLTLTSAAVERAEQALLDTDVLVLPHGFITDLEHQDLYDDEWVCVVSSGNSSVGDRLTVADLQTLPWVVSYDGPAGSTQAARSLRMFGVEPHVRVAVEGFQPVLRLVAGSDLIAFLPRGLVERTAAPGIRMLRCPVDLTPLTEAMWWHPVHESDPEHAYLRDVVRRVTGPVRDALRGNDR